ncbi:MAG: TAXI family TRAP transporter solute-binding subunit, partial [Cyclobacteriaceae bacterium]
MRYTLLLFLSVFLVFHSCKQKKPVYTFAYSDNEPEGSMAKAILDILEKSDLPYEFDTELTDGTQPNIDSIKAGLADIAIIENNLTYTEGIKTSLPLYKQVLHVFYKSDVPVASLEELVYGKKVYIGIEGSSSAIFMMDLFDFYDLEMSQFSITYNQFENDVFCGFSDIITEEVFLESLKAEGYKLFSFDDIDNYGKGSKAEAITLRYPHYETFVIPTSTYGQITESPVVTIATETILVVNSDLSDDFVYNLTKTIYREKQSLNEISPLVYGTMNEDFDRGEITFPLHNGARIFFDRDEPSFVERYAELGGVILSILLALISGLVSLSRWQKQKKKDRVDVFYKDLILIKNHINEIQTSKDGIEKLKSIYAQQNHAFDMLIEEKLEANESFRIYMELSKETISELKSRIRKLMAKKA